MIVMAKGTYIKCRGNDKPEWSEYHQRFYVAGERWIKSKRKFSSSMLLHNFVHYVELNEEEIKMLK